MTHQVSDEQLRHQLTNAFPSSEPTRHLASRINSLVTLPSQEAYRKLRQQESLRPVVWTTWMILMTCYVSWSLAVALRPSRSEAGLLDQMDGAMMAVHSAQITIDNVQPDGRRTRAGDVWYREGKEKVNVYLSGMTAIFLYRDEKQWVYTPSDNTVIIQRRTRSVDAPTSSFAFTDGLKSSEFGLNPVVKDLGETTEFSRPSHQVAVVVNRNTQFLYSLDPRTDLPFHKELQRKTGDVWATRATWDFKYNMALPDRLFRPDFPKNAHIIDKILPLKGLRQ